jgi:hypothetical protein
MTDLRQRVHIFAAVANGEGLGEACESADAEPLEVCEELVQDAAFATAIVAAQHERDRRNWRNLFIDLSRLQNACDEAASNAYSTYSEVEDLHATLTPPK